jgi:hypothetical protein
VSAEKRKEKGKAGEWTAARKGRWAAGPLGRKVRRFLFFSFPNLFQFKLFLSNSNQNSSNLFTKFYKLFKLHSTNQKLCKAK